MEKIVLDSKFFNIADTLNCGQIFRFKPYKKGFLVFSKDKICYALNEKDKAILYTNDKDYFYKFFDLDRDYSLIYKNAQNCGCDAICHSAKLGKGIRILNQDSIESLFSFIVSQNNNIPRIKGIIEKMCDAIGEKRSEVFDDDTITYSAFPTVQSLAKQDLNFFATVGLGYRAEYISRLSKDILNGKNIEALKDFDTLKLKAELLKIYGVGPKVADCVSLFGFHRTDSFPVDTWIYKVYVENMNGKLTDRKKISDELVSIYGDMSGYFQQYLFYYKRSLEKDE